MRKQLAILIMFLLASCIITACHSHTYEQGYKEGFIDGYEVCKLESADNSSDVSTGASRSEELPLMITENDIYELALIDAYQSEEQYTDSWSEKTMSEQCYVFKFKFHNKHTSSNIRIAIVDASINGYSLAGTSDFHSDDSFSVYTWSGENPDNTSVDCFKLFFSDIEAATDIRNAKDMGNASLSFVFRAYIIDEMDGYGEDSLFTIENAFNYCS